MSYPSRFPLALPPVSVMLDDISAPDASIARALAVKPATVARWRRQDQAPRPVLLALFWVTRWGVSLVNADAHNAASMYAAYARTLADEAQRLRAELARVVALHGTGAANDASLMVQHTARVLPFVMRR